MDVILILTAYILGINLLGFFFMGIDKRRARRRAFRIPEATLFTVALLGGSIGSIAGMYFFHHKTRHRHFVYGMPGILILQIILLILLLRSPIEIRIL